MADATFLTADAALAGQDPALVDLVDRLLDTGVVIRGELWLTVAGVELVFLGLDVVLCNPDRIRRSPPSAAGGGP